MLLPRLLQDSLEELVRLDAVEAVLLGGSRGRGKTPDAQSDYDLYVYVTADILLAQRKAILEPRSSLVEFGNQFWEPEDDGVFNDQTAYEWIYRRWDTFVTQVDEVVVKHRASVGYSTCLWDSFVGAHILFDRNGKAEELQRRWDVAPPKKLIQAIVAKNWPLLGEASCSYRRQIAQALSRQDWVSVQHRTAAFLASVFDLVFAVNEQRHPGEKRLLKQALLLPRLPLRFEALVATLTGPQPTAPINTLTAIDALTQAVRDFLSAAGYVAPVETSPTPIPKGVLTVYTDGGCIGNPGKGAWAYLVDDGTSVREGTGGEALTTNNKMELQAVIQALKAIAAQSEWKTLPIEVHTDSQYVRNGITTWIKSWEANGWKTASKEPVKNKELWVELQAWDNALKPRWKWVKGHAGNPRNERCDALVRQTMDGL